MSKRQSEYKCGQVHKCDPVHKCEPVHKCTPKCNQYIEESFSDNECSDSSGTSCSSRASCSSSSSQKKEPCDCDKCKKRRKSCDCRKCEKRRKSCKKREPKQCVVCTECVKKDKGEVELTRPKCCYEPPKKCPVEESSSCSKRKEGQCIVITIN